MRPGPGDPIDAALMRASARRKLFGDDEPAPRISRYVVERRIGGGTMGVVYAAHDPELDRKVAIKLLHAGAEEDAEASRLQREAQTLARLRHPNVIAAHDLGTWQGRVFLAMEYLAGSTLRAWLAARPRSWRAVVEILGAAGRGLAAAHRAGIVHRDFKPDNVLVGDGGEVRVVDFGLAHVGRAAGEAQGGFAGTPAYAAPECVDGRPADARSDQYSFCVTLHEALFGARPRAMKGEPAAASGSLPAVAGRVPVRLRRILARGLAPEPGARFSSMDGLLAALTRDPAVPIRRGAAAVAVAAVAVAATYGFTRGSSPGAGDPCAGGTARLAGVWDAEARARVEQAFIRTDAPFAADAYHLAAARLDAYAADWVAAHAAACRATRVTGEQSEELLDRRMACLSGRLDVLDELVDVLGDADAEMVRRAPAAAHQLPELAPCADLSALRERVPPPADAATLARVEALRARLARAEARALAGDLIEAGRLAQGIVDDARAVGYAPVLAEALVLRGRLGPFDPDSTDRVWLEAGRVGAEARDDRIIAHAWIKRMLIVGYARGDHAAALAMRPFAEAAVARAGHDAVLEAQLLNTVAIVFDEMGRHDEAQGLFREALALRERAYGPEHPEVAYVLSNLGDSHRIAGDLEGARGYLERSLAIARKALGPYHPSVAPAAQNLGAVFLELGDLPRARELTETALSLYGGMSAEDQPGPRALLGVIAFRQGDTAEALAHLERATEVVRRTHPDHPGAGTVELQHGMVLRGAGRLDEAIGHLERARAIREQALGLEHHDVAEAYLELGRALQERGDTREARRLLDRADAICRRLAGAAGIRRVCGGS